MDSTHKNRKAISSIILALFGILFYVSSILVSISVPFFPGFFAVVLGLFGLGGIVCILGLILGIGGARQPRMKALAIVSIILCILILAMVSYSGIVMLLDLL